MKTRFSDHNQFDSDHRLHCLVKLKISYTHDAYKFVIHRH